MRLGKVRGTAEHEEMIRTRSEFKKELNDCKANERQELSLSIMEKFAIKNNVQFWREVKRKRKTSKVSNIIDEKNIDSDIAGLFLDKFIPSQQNNFTDLDSALCDRIKEQWHFRRKMNLCVSSETIKKLVARLNTGQGHDLIHSIFF